MKVKKKRSRLAKRKRILGRDAQQRHFDGRGYENDYVGSGLRRRHVDKYEQISNEE